MFANIWNWIKSLFGCGTTTTTEEPKNLIAPAHGHGGPRDRKGKSHNHPQVKYEGHNNVNNDKVR